MLGQGHGPFCMSWLDDGSRMAAESEDRAGEHASEEESAEGVAGPEVTVELAPATEDEDAEWTLLASLTGDSMRGVLDTLLRHPDEEVRGAAVRSLRVSPARETSGAEASSQLSAKVLSSEPLTLGVEAEEDAKGRGDVTEEFRADLTRFQARQVFRVGGVRLLVDPEGGAPVPASAQAVVKNDGAAPWPKTTTAVLVEGEPLGLAQLPIGAVPPGSAAEVLLDFYVPARATPGATRSAWAFIDAATGARLGPILVFEVTWVDK